MLGAIEGPAWRCSADILFAVPAKERPVGAAKGPGTPVRHE